MDNIQIQIFNDTGIFRKSPNYPTYPPYHQGLYLEETFFEFFCKNDPKNHSAQTKYYLPIFWTTVYNDNILGVQKYLDSLNPEYEYFTVCQHDDAVIEKLPKNTIVYSAGGNRGDVPIPLVCSKIPPKYTITQPEKTKLASFVGSMTHPIRKILYDNFFNDSDFAFKTKNWSPKINDLEFDAFVNETLSSKFTLCPRGYGKTSFRLYESFQLNSVPVYISDEFWLPFNKTINWEDICVLVLPKEIPNIKKILSSINSERYNMMLEKGKLIWSEYFEINHLCQKIIETLYPRRRENPPTF